MIEEAINFTVVIESIDLTDKLAAKIGQQLRGNEVIELVGDLGSGKTTFTKALVKGAGSSDHVSSPSFSLRNDYQAKSFNIAHFDFYRLNDPGIVKDMLAEAIIDQQIVVVVEWAGVIEDILPPESIRLTLKVIDKTTRSLSVMSQKQFSYLFKALDTT